MRLRFILALCVAAALPGAGAAQTTTNTTAAPAPPKLTPQDFIGVWRDTSNSKPLVIDPADPDEPAKADRLYGRTQNHRTGKAEGWGGSFFAAGAKPAHVSLQRQPHVEEMNPQIPDWARAKIVNQLTWRLDLTLNIDDGFNPILKGQFFPGEVQWSDDGKTAKVVGPGKPVDIAYEIDPNITLDAYVAPVIAFDYRNRKPIAHPEVRYLLKGDAFKIMVTLPQPMAQAQGLTLPLKFHALTSGGTATVQLQTNALALKALTAAYTDTDEIVIANRGDASDREPLFGLFPPASGFGPRLNLATKNGEEIEMSAAGATYRFRVFDNVLELALARRIDAISQLMLPIRTKLALATDASEIQDLSMRVRMGRTALKAAADHSYPTEVRLAVLDLYLTGDGEHGLLTDSASSPPVKPGAKPAPSMTDGAALHWIAQTDPDWSKANRFGTQWAAYEEAIAVDGPRTLGQSNFWRANDIRLGRDLTSVGINTVEHAQADYKKKLQDAFMRLAYKETAFAMFNLVADETPTEKVMVAFGGVDRFGNKVPLSDRVTSIIGLAADPLVKSVINDVTLQAPIRKTISSPGRQVMEELGWRAGGVLPEDMSPGVWQRLRATSTPEGDAKPTIRGRFMQPEKNRSPIERDMAFSEGCRYPHNPDAALPSDPHGRLYKGGGTKMLGLDETEYQQVDPVGCVAAATARGVGNKINQRDIMEDIHELRAIRAIEEGKPVWKGPGLERGILLEELAPVLADNGIPSVLLERTPGWKGYNVLLAIEGCVEKDLAVVVGLRYPGYQNHAVLITSFEKSPNGRTIAVHVFDPAPGDSRRLTTQEFTKYFRDYSKLRSIGAAVAIAFGKS